MQNLDQTAVCDSLGMVAGVVKESSSAPEFEALHLASHHWAVRIGCCLRIVYVESYPNTADGPSREDVSCAVCAELGVQLRSLEWPLVILPALDGFALQDWAAAMPDAEQASARSFSI